MPKKNNKNFYMKKWGAFDFEGVDIKNNIIELLIDFCLISDRFRIGQYFQIDEMDNSKFYNLNEIYDIYKYETFFEGNYPFTTDIVRDIHLFVKNNKSIIIEYDPRKINRFNKYFKEFRPPITTIYLNQLLIERIYGNLDDFDILVNKHLIGFYRNTLNLKLW